MNPKELKNMIDFIAKSGLAEVNIETETFKIKVKRDTDVKIETSTVAAAPVAVQPANPVPVAAPPAPVNNNVTEETGSNAEDNSKYIEIKSPMIGTFYRSPNPDSPVFVSVGDTISAGQKVCIVEAMKLFNEIESEVSGTIVKVLVENSSPVEYDQPLFLVDPS